MFPFDLSDRQKLSAIPVHEGDRPARASGGQLCEPRGQTDYAGARYCCRHPGPDAAVEVTLFELAAGTPALWEKQWGRL
jgi:hypothetical protein